MKRKLILVAAAFVVAQSLSGTAFAGANDYAFEAVKAEVKKADDAIIAVRRVRCEYSNQGETQ